MGKYKKFDESKYEQPIKTVPGQYATGYFFLRYDRPMLSIQSKSQTATEFPVDAINDLLRITNLLNDAIIEWDTRHKETVQDA